MSILINASQRNTYDDDHRQYAWTDPTDGMANVMLHRGDKVVSFRGEEFTFEGVDRYAYGSSEGRVAVSRRCSQAYDNGHGGTECPHIWHRDGIDRQEYFPSVFGLYLGDAHGVKA